MRIELNCAKCGGNRFSLNRGYSDLSVIFCEDCGHEIGTLERLKQLVADEVMRRAAGGRDAVTNGAAKGRQR